MSGTAPTARPIPTGPAPGSAEPPQRKSGGLALFAVCLGFFMVLMDSSALNVALPSIRSEFAGSLTGLEWTVNGYTIAMAAFLLSGGSLGDRFGARRVFQTSLIAFALSSAACSASPNLAFLVAARVVQGVAAGGLLPASLAVIAHMYTAPAQRAKALTVWGGVSSLALVLGPIIGGALTSGVGWRAIFLINVPVGALAVVLTALKVVPSPTHDATFDLAGQIVAVVIVGCGIGALIEGGAHGWNTPLNRILVAATVGGLMAFVLIERAAPHPVLPLHLFTRPRFVFGLLVGALFQFGAYGAQFALSLHLQNAWRLSPLDTGLAFVPFATMWAFASFVLARAVTRTGPRALLIIGAVAAAAGSAALLPLGPHPAWWIFFAGSCLLGLGPGLMGPSLPTVVLGALPAHQSGLASGALNALRQVGGAVSIAVFGALIESSTRTTGLRICLALVGAGFLLTIAAVMGGLPHRRPSTTNS